MSDKINGVSMETLKEVDRQLALFKEGEKIAARQKVMGASNMKEIAEDIMLAINWEVGYESIEKVIKVYQGFLDNGGWIDFTKE